MVSLSDIKPLLYASRFFGCGPHVVTEHDVLLTSPGLAYSSLWAVGFMCTCIYGMYMVTQRQETDQKILVLATSRTFLAYVCFFIDGIISIKCNERLRSALLQLRSFDTAVGYNIANISTRRFCSASWLAVAMVILFWLTVGYITYICDMTSPLFNAIIYVVANAAISMQIIKFAGLLILLHQRFRYLLISLQPDGFTFAGVEVSRGSRGMNGRGAAEQRRVFQLRDVWWLHCILSNAADTINSMYSMQLLFWLAIMWLNALSRIYALSENSARITGLLMKIRESLLVIAYVFNMLIVTAACHFTAHEANAIGKVTFNPQSACVMKRHSLEETVKVGIYFNLRQLRFSAAGGFIYIDLPLLLSITGTMTTYLVVLHNNT